MPIVNQVNSVRREQDYGSHLRVGHSLPFVPSGPSRQQSRLAQCACDVKSTFHAHVSRQS